MEGTFQLWDLVTFSEIASRKAHNDFVTQLLHTPGNIRKNKIKIAVLRIPTATCLVRTNSSIFADALAFFMVLLLSSADEGAFISASADATLKIWDAQVLECKHVLKGHSRSVTSIAHSKEYNCVLSAGLDQVCG